MQPKIPCVRCGQPTPASKSLCDYCIRAEQWKREREEKAAILRTKRGKFYLTRYLLESMDTACIFGSVLIYRAEMLYGRDSVEYFAMSDQFEVVPEGNETPEYIATINTNFTPPKVTWKRA